MLLVRILSVCSQTSQPTSEAVRNKWRTQVRRTKEQKELPKNCTYFISAPPMASDEVCFSQLLIPTASTHAFPCLSPSVSFQKKEYELSLSN